MKRKKLLFPSMLFLLCLAVSSHAADISAASCSRSDVQSAINSASDGDRVLVPAGSCTWTSMVSVPNTKGITIQGAGVGVTTITTNFTAESTLLVIIAPGNSLARVTGFTWDGNLVQKSGVGAQVYIWGDGLNSFRIDNNDFTRFKSRAVTYEGNGLEVSGLIDNNTWDDDGGNIQGYTLLCATAATDGDASFPANLPFGRSLDLGGSDFIFIEDNTFTYAAISDQTGTISGGCRVVFRHNTIDGTTYGHHGADSGGRRGVHSFEIYDNTWLNPPGTPRAFIWRSGVGVFFNNTFTGTYTAGEIHNFRSCSPQSGVWGGECDGTNAWDENTATFEGWRCLDQVGSLFAAAQGGGAVSMPAYAWDNEKNGSPFDIDRADLINSCTRFRDLHMLENRDYYNEVSSFDGTIGVGVGLLSARPATCTPEVAYWATDETTLYKCTATDTWTTYYPGPFTYPHPLRSEGNANRPDPPTNLRVVVQ